MYFEKEDWDEILFFTARSLAYHQGTFKNLNKIYDQNPDLFYNLAEQHPLRHHCLMRTLPLEYEAKTTRMLGVLLEAENDDKLKEFVIRQIKLFNPKLYDFVKKPTFHLAEKYMEEVERTNTREMYYMDRPGLLQYLINYMYPDETAFNSADKEGVLKRVEAYLTKCIRYRTKASSEQIAIYGGEHKIKIEDDQKDFMQRFKSWVDISEFNDIWTAAVKQLQKLDSQSNQDFIDNFDRIRWEDIKGEYNISNFMIYKDLIMNPENFNDGILLTETFTAIRKICIMSELSTELLVSSNDLKKDEREKLAILSGSIGRKGFESSYIDFRMDKYAYNIFIYLLLQQYKKAKELYFQDNEEKRLIEQRKNTEKIKQTEQKLKESEQKNQQLLQEIQRLKSENAQLKSELSKSEKEVKRQYTNKIQNLEQTIEHQDAMLYDLAPLREFAFSLESEMDYSEEKLSLQPYLEKHKIAILGGHENLQKKLRQVYSDVLVLNGTQRSIDFQSVLQKIDILFLFTEHMSHSVYYNAIAAAERYHIKLAYMRENNLDMIEYKMADQIRKMESEKA